MTGAISYYATRSLNAIEEWMMTAQSNITGSTRTAYKENSLMYGNGVVDIQEEPTTFTAGKMIGEQCLNTGHVVTNWDNGEIVSSTQDTHFAIQGSGFFLVADPKFIPGGSVNGQNPLPANGLYLTRDGEFHFATHPGILGGNKPVLTTLQGFVVMADIAAPGPNYGDSDNVWRFITLDEFESVGPLKVPDDPVTLDKRHVLPSVVQPSYDAPGAGALQTVIDYNELTYSRYGSTIFEIPPTAQSVKTIINGTAGNNTSFDLTPGVNSQDSGSYLRQGALESANVNMGRNITELSMLGKVFNAFTQLIRVVNSNLDEVLNFVR